MDVGESHQSIYKSILSRTKKGTQKIKQLVVHPLSQILEGATLTTFGGWLINLAGWNFDWAQFDPVDVPWPAGHAQYPGWGWYLYGDGLGLAGLASIYTGAKMIGNQAGYLHARAYEDAKESSVVDKTANRLKNIGIPLGLTTTLSGLGISGVTYYLHHFQGMDNFLGMTYGQIWNLAHMGLTSLGSAALLAGSFASGLSRGRERYRKEFNTDEVIHIPVEEKKNTFSRERYPDTLPSYALQDSYPNPLLSSGETEGVSPVSSTMQYVSQEDLSKIAES